MIATNERQTRTAEALTERLLEAAASTFGLFAVYLGDRLGYYRHLADAGPLDPGELARRSGTHERYAREWLEQQAVLGLVEVEHEDAPAQERRFSLPPAHAAVLADEDSLDFLAPLAQLVVGAVSPMPLVVRAYRAGTGVPFSEYGRDLREGQGRMNRGMLLQQLGHEWLPAVPALHGRLAAAGARAADFGCGQGYASIGLARAYPALRVDGFDLDGPSIDDARANAARHGVADRVRFERRDVSDPALAGRYDLVFACEVLHDLGDPVGALRVARGLLREGGEVLIMDERAGERFAAGCGVWERVLYGFSVHHCLPSCLADGDAGTGTVMRPETVRRYAQAAGFRQVVLAPIDHPFFAFYRLIP
ncbi:MAG: methyltransferase domain-containing protein [Planctomycetes bacterium]|nr:methyltransferase domain-containing protein [Planctomycetota bacterium]